MTKDIVLAQAKKALEARPDSTALAVSLNTSEIIHDLLKDDPNYKYDDSGEFFEHTLFGKQIIVAENLGDNLIVGVLIGDPLEDKVSNG